MNKMHLGIKVLGLFIIIGICNQQVLCLKSKVPSQFAHSIKSLATMINKAFENQSIVGNLKMLEQLKKQLIEVKQEGVSSDQSIRFIKMNKDTLVQDQIVVKKHAKFDKVTANSHILVSENIYSKNQESQVISTKDLYLSTINSLNLDESIVIQGKIRTKKLTIEDKANIQALKVNGQKQWQIIEHEDFESSNINKNNQWNLIELNSCEQMNSNKFNGGYCKISTQQIIKTFTNLPQHTQLKLSGNLHAFDNWEGEKMYVLVNGKRVWSRNIDNSKAGVTSVCGNDRSDSINIKFEKIIMCSDDSIEVTFGSELTKDSCEASFAIDDIIVSVR